MARSYWLELRKQMVPSEFNAFTSEQPDLLTMAIYILLVLGLLAVLLLLTSRLGAKKPSPVKGAPYESGMIPSGTARFAYPAPFYLIAIFFLIFDVEAAFIFSWAVAFEQLGWLGWLRITFFIAILLLSLLYLRQKGGLDWSTAGQRS